MSDGETRARRVDIVLKSQKATRQPTMQEIVEDLQRRVAALEQRWREGGAIAKARGEAND